MELRRAESVPSEVTGKQFGDCCFVVDDGNVLMRHGVGVAGVL